MPARAWKKIGKGTRAIARRSADNDGKFCEGYDKGFRRPEVRETIGFTFAASLEGSINHRVKSVKLSRRRHIRHYVIAVYVLALINASAGDFTRKVRQPARIPEDSKITRAHLESGPALLVINSDSVFRSEIIIF